MNYKQMAIVLGVAFTMVGSNYETAEASWLSKAWDRLETSSAKASPNWPKAEQYRDYYPGQVIGNPLPDSDFMVAGISLWASFDDIKRSLGTPTQETKEQLIYGGITYGYSMMSGSPERISYIFITNRDATTARGIAVGDSLKKVLEVYGRPDYIDYNNRWFYGRLKYRSDYRAGISFEHKGNKVTKIIID